MQEDTQPVLLVYCFTSLLCEVSGSTDVVKFGPAPSAGAENVVQLTCLKTD